MRIAWLTPYLPQQENTGGRIRIARLAHGFEASDELYLYSRISQHDGGDAPGAERPPFGPFRKVQAEAGSGSRAFWRLRPSPARHMPLRLQRLLESDDAAAAFDAVVVEHCYASEALPKLRRAAVILDEHNIESRYFRRKIAREPLQAFEYLKWHCYERAVWRRADEVVTVSREDADIVRKAQPSKGVVVPNGTRVEAFRYVPPSARSGSAVLYVGMMSYPPNVAAVTTLARVILPALRTRVPDATLTIVGRDAVPAVRELACDYVRVTGTVPEVFQLFDEHAAYAMPVFQGAGSSLKVLEPFASGMPLVASAFGVRGYDLDGSEYLRADNTAEFVEGLCRALTGRQGLDVMAERARRVAERYSWTSISLQFSGVVRTAVEARRAAAQRTE